MFARTTAAECAAAWHRDDKSPIFRKHRGIKCPALCGARGYIQENETESLRGGRIEIPGAARSLMKLYSSSMAVEGMRAAAAQREGKERGVEFLRLCLCPAPRHVGRDKLRFLASWKGGLIVH